MVEHAGDALENRLVHGERRVLRKVAALGVPAEEKRALHRRRHARGVGQGGALGGNDLFEAQVEVLLPAGEAPVGAAEKAR